MSVPESVKAAIRSEFARSGGVAKTPAKASSARLNGAKGGRPRKGGSPPKRKPRIAGVSPQFLYELARDLHAYEQHSWQMAEVARALSLAAQRIERLEKGKL